MSSKRYQSHVIIEGPDCVGKSTLAHRLCDEYGFAYHHEGVPAGEGSLLEHYAKLLLKDQSTCFDRHFVGEPVYSAVMRNGKF